MKDLDPYQDCLCLATRRLSRLLTQLYDKHLSQAELKVTQFSLLVALDKGKGEATLGDVARALDMDASTLTRNLCPLVRDGLAEFISASEDQREKKARLTEAGRARLIRAKALWADAQKVAIAKLGKQSNDQLKALLNSVRS